MEQPKRLYRGNDTDMLRVISSIVASAISYENALTSKHSQWAPPYFSTLQTNINNVVQKYIGVNNATNLHKAMHPLPMLHSSATAEAIQAYNGLYEEVISVARNAARDFKNNPVIQKRFSYDRVLKQLIA